jgi:hypothetical protein
MQLCALRDAVHATRLTHGAPQAGPYVTLSVGVATEVPIDGMSSALLVVARADQALYAAKHGGRDRVLSSDKALASFLDEGAGPRRGSRPVIVTLSDGAADMTVVAAYQSEHSTPARAGAGGVWSSGCRGRSCPAGSYAAVAVAAFCQSRPSGDQESWESALTKRS